jgi:hypothetical protein
MTLHLLVVLVAGVLAVVGVNQVGLEHLGKALLVVMRQHTKEIQMPPLVAVVVQQMLVLQQQQTVLAKRVVLVLLHPSLAHL